MTRHPALPLGRPHCKHCGREMTPEQREQLRVYCTDGCASAAMLLALANVQRVPTGGER